MSLEAIRSAMADAVDGITVYGVRIRATPYITDQVNPVQAAVGLSNINYQMVFGGTKCPRDFTIAVYCNRTAEEQAQKLFDELSEISGSTSVKAALQDDSALAALVDYIEVTSASGPRVATVGETDYLAMEFLAQVVAS